ncbi:MAG: 30S ribosomal protein S18 [Candidatus Levybacteria bacterium]|nr:30S ribosomal protein S18 [Candidatus Levybacteria bacterium]
MAARKTVRRPRRKIIVPKNCYFCTEKKSPWFSDTETLKRFVTDRGKIIGRARSGICSMHQKRLTVGIKHARHLALLSFIG